MADNRVILKKSSVASKVPSSSDLEYGELAVNYADGLIYFKDSSNNIRFFEETNSFQNVDVSGQTTLTADGGSDTLTFVEGDGIGIITDGATNEITIEAVGSAGNDFVDSASFNTINGELTLTRTDAGTIVVDLDGRFLLQGAKAADADLLDGENGAYYLDYNNFTNTPTLYNSSDFDTDFSSKSTSDLSEGSNLYYTDSRTRNALSASGDLSYDSATGTFSYTERSDSDIRGLFSASGDLTYDSATGNFSVTVPAGYNSSDFDSDFSGKSTSDLSEGSNLYYTDTRVDSHLSGGTGVSYSSGTISIGQSVGTSDNVEFNDVIVGGNLTVSGTTTTVNTETLDIADNNITLNSNYSGSSPTENGGITVNRGTQSDVVLQWNESSDHWEIESGGVTGRILTTGDEGSGNGLDADLLDGENGTYYLDYNNFSNTPTIGNGTLTVSGGSGLTGSGTFDANQTTNATISVDHADTSSQGSVNNSGSTVIQDVTLDGFGHVTNLNSKTISGSDVGLNDSTITINAGAGLSTGGSFTTNQGSSSTITIDHADTSTQGDVNNSGGTVIQDISVDTYGHITSVGSADLDSRYLQSESDTLDSVTDRGNSTTNDISAGAITANPFFENTNSITSSYTITSGYNAMAAGPITVEDGVTITVPDGSRWVVV